MTRASVPALLVSLTTLACLGLLAQRQSRSAALLDRVESRVAAIESAGPPHVEMNRTGELAGRLSAEIQEVRLAVDRLRSTEAEVVAPASSVSGSDMKSAVLEALRQIQAEHVAAEKARMAGLARSKVEAFLAGLDTSMTLAAEQRRQIATILDAASVKEVETIGTRTQSSMPWSQLSAIRKEADTQVRQLLSPDQQKQFAQYSRNHSWSLSGGLKSSS